MKYKFALFFLLTFLFSFSQKKEIEEDYVNDHVLKYDDYVYKTNIKTIQFHQTGWDYGAPLISLHSNEQLELSFDDMDGDQKQYSISFVHCNADWTPSDLMVSEYLSGFFDMNILNFSYAINTMQKYTHYSIVFPQYETQQNTRFTKSGNYIMYVYEGGEKENLAFCRRLMVFDNKASITTSFRQTVGGDNQFKHQQLDFTITSAGYDITNPYRDLNVVIVQNNRWDNSVTNIKPTFLGNNQLIYSLDEASSFRGGNEFRYFDSRSLRFLTERVKEIYRDSALKNHIVLLKDELRGVKPYLFYNDFNGNFLIKNREALSNLEIEGDYVFVEFFLPYPIPESKGNFYVMGKLTDWRMNKLSKMTYNYKRMGYETKLYLKQGFYNYMYVLSNDTKKGGDETITEGSHWDTENDYNIYIYHRKFGWNYDQLIAAKKINSHKR